MDTFDERWRDPARGVAHIMTCSITGTATAAKIIDPTGGQLVWRQADPEIHVSRELLDICDAEGLAFLTERYELGEWCPHDPITRHARRKDTL